MKMDLLYRHAADLGVEVTWRDLGTRRRGDYCNELRLIRLNTRLTGSQAVSTLAHELAHALFGDEHSTDWIEQRADEAGASLIITPDEYRAAERVAGEHVAGLATELGVTPRMVLAWRRWWFRQPSDIAA